LSFSSPEHAFTPDRGEESGGDGAFESQAPSRPAAGSFSLAIRGFQDDNDGGNPNASTSPIEASRMTGGLSFSSPEHAFTPDRGEESGGDGAFESQNRRLTKWAITAPPPDPSASPIEASRMTNEKGGALKSQALNWPVKLKKPRR
ncbi:MAG TPA: hypothetical protein VLH15_04515, partial [Dehalococcoidales bacterium]|nr:hypothetical protein [Dehalococcoidales bacterium]